MAVRVKPPGTAVPAAFAPNLGPAVPAASLPPLVPPMRPAPQPAPPAAQAAPATPTPTPATPIPAAVQAAPAITPAPVHPALAASGGNPPPPVSPTPAAVAAPEPQPAPLLAVQGEPVSPIASVAARQRAAEVPQTTSPAQRAESPPNDRRVLMQVGGAVLVLLILAGIGLWAVWPKGQQQAVIPVNQNPVVLQAPPAPTSQPVIIHNYPPAVTPAPAQAQPLSGNVGGGGSITSPPGEPVEGDGAKVKIDEPTWLIRN